MTPVPASTSVATTNGLANRVIIPLLHTTAGRRLGRRLAVVEYAGRRTGLRHQLIVLYRIEGPTVHIDVGKANRKTWWRTFESRHPLRLRLAGVDHDASALSVRDGRKVSVLADLDPSADVTEQVTT